MLFCFRFKVFSLNDCFWFLLLFCYCSCAFYKRVYVCAFVIGVFLLFFCLFFGGGGGRGVLCCVLLCFLVVLVFVCLLLMFLFLLLKKIVCLFKKIIKIEINNKDKYSTAS